jgi:hypothetical protein
MTDRKQDQDHDVDRDRDHDEPKGGDKAIAPAPKGGALASLQALAAMFNNVDTRSIVGRSSLPMLLFRSRENTWGFGQKQIEPQEGSRWAVNVRSFRYGYVCFGDNGKKLDERMVSIDQPMPDRATLPDLGFKWNEQWSVALKCIDGADAGIEVIHPSTTVGGIKAIAGVIDAVRDRLNSGQHDGKLGPIVYLERDSYQHPQYGRVWEPILRIVDWMPLDGPAPAAPPPPSPPTPPTSSAAEQPRRRRVA